MNNEQVTTFISHQFHFFIFAGSIKRRKTKVKKNKKIINNFLTGRKYVKIYIKKKINFVSKQMTYFGK